jgi:hypothetical protein
MPTRQQVAQFLNDFKAAMSLGFVRWLERSAEGKTHLTGLNINRNQAIEYLLALTPDNYCRGPDPDDFEPSREVWIFGCDVEGVAAYIKLTLQPDPRRRSVVWGLIWGFHKAEYPLKFPLRDVS